MEEPNIPTQISAPESATAIFQKASNGKIAVFLYAATALLSSAVPSLADMTMDRWNAMSVFQQSGFFLGILLATLVTLKAATSSSARNK